jgi:hypothetical protein
VTRAGGPAALDRITGERDVERRWKEGELVPETILPTQFADLQRNGASKAPEHRLMLAVLEEAIRVYQTMACRADRRSRRLFREAQEWFASDEASWPFSFVVICEKLGFEPAYVQSGLNRWWVHRTAACEGVPSLLAGRRRIAGSRLRVQVIAARLRSRGLTAEALSGAIRGRLRAVAGRAR